MDVIFSELECVGVTRFYRKTTRRICAIFFWVQEKTLVHYNLHWKELHPAFNAMNESQTTRLNFQARLTKLVCWPWCGCASV